MAPAARSQEPHGTLRLSRRRGADWQTLMRKKNKTSETTDGCCLFEQTRESSPSCVLASNFSAFIVWSLVLTLEHLWIRCVCCHNDNLWLTASLTFVLVLCLKHCRWSVRPPWQKELRLRFDWWSASAWWQASSTSHHLQSRAPELKRKDPSASNCKSMKTRGLSDSSPDDVAACLVFVNAKLPITGQRVRHTEFLGIGSGNPKKERQIHALHLTESSHLSQLHLRKQKHRGEMWSQRNRFSENKKKPKY